MKPPHDRHDLATLTGRVRANATTTSQHAIAWTRSIAAPAAREMIGQVRASATTTSQHAIAWTRSTAAPAAMRAAPRAGILYITHSWLLWPVVLMLCLAWAVGPAPRLTIGIGSSRPLASGPRPPLAGRRATHHRPPLHARVVHIVPTPMAPPNARVVHIVPTPMAPPNARVVHTVPTPVVPQLGPVGVVRLVRVVHDRTSSPTQVRVITRMVAPSPTPCASHSVVPPAGPCGYPYMRALAPNPDGAIFHRPSIGVYAIIRLLRQMGSPLATAQTCDDAGSCMSVAAWLWRSGLVRGEDPLVLLAMCYEESHCGRDGEAALNHSLGNERPLGAADVMHCPAPGSCYHHADTWGAGIEDAYDLLARYARGEIARDPLTHQPVALPTLWAAIPTWAPPGDGNDPASYRAAAYSIIQAWTGRSY